MCKSIIHQTNIIFVKTEFKPNLKQEGIGRHHTSIN